MFKKYLRPGIIVIALIALVILGVTQFGNVGMLRSSILGDSAGVSPCTEQWYRENSSKLASSITNSADIQKKIDAIAGDITTKQEKAREGNLTKSDVEANYQIRKQLFDKTYLTRSGFNRYRRLCEEPRGYYVEPCKEYTKFAEELEKLQKEVEDSQSTQKTLESNYTTVNTEKATLQKNLDDTMKFIAQMNECASRLNLAAVSSEVRLTPGSGNAPTVPAGASSQNPTSNQTASAGGANTPANTTQNPTPPQTTPPNPPTAPAGASITPPNPSTPAPQTPPTTPASQTASYTCTDSDGGKDIMKFGKVVLKRDASTLETKEDICDYQSEESDIYGVVEYSCTAPTGTTSGIVKSEFTPCEYDCDEGACLTKAQYDELYADSDESDPLESDN